MIMEYVGPFRTGTRELIGNTVAKCKCDYCGTKWECLVRTLKRYKHNLGLGAICRMCTSLGKPLLFEEVHHNFPRIKRIYSKVGRGGHIRGDTCLVFDCIDCGKEKATKYETCRGQNFSWRCTSCNRRHIQGQELIYPYQMNALLDWNANTLGLIGQLAEKTRVVLRCEECEEVFETRWAHYRDGGRKCKPCIQATPMTEDGARRVSDANKHHWANPEYREKMTLARQGSHSDYTTYMSEPHKKLKQLMEKVGLTDFVSEQWIAKGIRVDEIDFSRKIVLEFNGDYYHANPSKYKADDVLILGNRGQVIVQSVWDDNAKRTAYIHSLGYKIITVWESDFKHDKQGVVNGIVQYVSAN